MKKLIVFIAVLISANSYSQIQMTDSIIDFNSLSSILVVAKKGKIPIWNATGFFLQVKKTIYFITNNHVVGGIYHTEEFKRLHSKDSKIDTLPDNLAIRLYDKEFNTFRFETIGLTDSKGNLLYRKIYENEKDTTSILDVVAIPMNESNKLVGHIILNGYDSATLGNITLYPSQKLFVIGYPQGVNVLYPIWKGGTIASEPNLLSIKNSVFGIDATTRKGMSGSPVVFRDSKIDTPNGVELFPTLVTKLIGIYSAQNYDSEIGFVTRIETIYNTLKKIAD